MGHFFDSELHCVLSKISDLILANVLFIIGCIPVFTMGASLRALYQVCAGIMREEGHVCRNFWAFYRRDFGHTCACFFLWAAGAAVAAADFVIVMFIWQPVFGDILLGLLLLAELLLLFAGSYLFPVLACGKRPVRKVFVLSFYLSLRYLHRTIVICTLNLLPVVLMIFRTYAFALIVPAWFIIGFSLTAYVNLRLLHPALDMLGGLKQAC